MTRTKSSVIPFLVPHRKVWLMPTARVPCSNAANIEERKTWTQSDTFAPGTIPLRGKSRQNVYIVYQPRRWSNILLSFDQGCKRDLSLQDRDIRFLVRDETETKTFLQFHETETRPMRLIFAMRRDRDRDLARPRPRRFSRPSTCSIVPKQ